MNLQHANGAAAEMLVASRFFAAGYDILAVADGQTVRLFTWEETKGKKSMCVGKRNTGVIL